MRYEGDRVQNPQEEPIVTLLRLRSGGGALSAMPVRRIASSRPGLGRHLLLVPAGTSRPAIRFRLHHRRSRTSDAEPGSAGLAPPQAGPGFGCQSGGHGGNPAGAHPERAVPASGSPTPSPAPPAPDLGCERARRSSCSSVTGSISPLPVIGAVFDVVFYMPPHPAVLGGEDAGAPRLPHSLTHLFDGCRPRST